MTKLIKPISDHRFHDYPDDLLTNLIKNWRMNMENGKGDERICKMLIDDAYKILGYRCALEYIAMYEGK